jgi:hypothetical protein
MIRNKLGHILPLEFRLFWRLFAEIEIFSSKNQLLR